MINININSHSDTCYSPSSNLNIESHEQLTTPHFELIKIIKRYEYCSGWTLLIAPDELPEKNKLLACSVNLNKVLTISKRQCNRVLSIAYQALKQDNCSALVVWCDTMSEIEIKLLKQKANLTSTRLYILNRKNHNAEYQLH